MLMCGQQCSITPHNLVLANRYYWILYGYTRGSRNLPIYNVRSARRDSDREMPFYITWSPGLQPLSSWARGLDGISCWAKSWGASTIGPCRFIHICPAWFPSSDIIRRIFCKSLWFLRFSAVNSATTAKIVIPRETPRPAPTATTFGPWVSREGQSFGVSVGADPRVGHMPLGVGKNPGVIEVALGFVAAPTEVEADAEEEAIVFVCSPRRTTWPAGTVKLDSGQLSPSQAKIIPAGAPHEMKVFPPFGVSLWLKHQGISIIWHPSVRGIEYWCDDVSRGKAKNQCTLKAKFWAFWSSPSTISARPSRYS